MATNVTVNSRHGESAERLIRRFTKKVKKEGILEDARNYMFYEKPSVKRRRKEKRSQFLRTLGNN